MKYEQSGAGEPIVLLPGGLTGWISWIPHAELLSVSRTVIRLQLHNVDLGLSGAPLPDDYSVEYEAASLARTLDALNIQQADLAGWSYGALIALNYAIRHPERVRTLTMIEPPAYWVLSSLGTLPQELIAEREYLRTYATDDVTEDLLVEFMYVSGLVGKDTDPLSLPQWPLWYEHRQSLRIGIAEYYQDSIDLLHRFDVPVLLVKGEGSNPNLHAVVDALAEELPDARVVIFPGGHAAHIASMQPFLDTFTGFMSRVRARS